MQRIYDLVARRLMAALSPDAVIATSELDIAALESGLLQCIVRHGPGDH